MSDVFGDDSLLNRTQFSPVAKVGLGLLVLLVLALVLFLIFPLQNSNLPSWIIDLQSRLWVLLTFLGPYLLVALLAGIVGLAELTATFQTYPREALRTRWAWVLVLVNVLFAILAMMIVQATMPAMNQTLQVIGVGIGFQAIIRTKFILAKPVGQRDLTPEQGEVSVNLGWLYDQFQNLCRTQIDLELMNNRRTAVTRLIEYYPSLAELYDIAWYTIIARATLSPEEEALRLERLEKLIDPKAPENFAQASIALMILENGGQGYVQLLLTQARNNNTAEIERVMSPGNKNEQLVRLLMDRYTLDALVDLGKRLTDNEAIITWMEAAAQPTPETSQANQKSAIAHFLVQQIGMEPIHQAMATDNLPANPAG